MPTIREQLTSLVDADRLEAVQRCDDARCVITRVRHAISLLRRAWRGKVFFVFSVRLALADEESRQATTETKP